MPARRQGDAVVRGPVETEDDLPGVILHRAVVLLEPERPRLAAETEIFRALVKGAFGARRKTLRNAWSRVADGARVARAAVEAGISLDARGETLDVEAFARMASLLSPQ